MLTVIDVRYHIVLNSDAQQFLIDAPEQRRVLVFWAKHMPSFVNEDIHKNVVRIKLCSVFVLRKESPKPWNEIWIFKSLAHANKELFAFLYYVCSLVVVDLHCVQFLHCDLTPARLHRFSAFHYDVKRLLIAWSVLHALLATLRVTHC